MSADQRTEQEMRQFLLGQLREDQRLKLEAELFRDTEKFELMEAMEDELMQDFVAGDLPADERRFLEKRWAARPAKQADLVFARELRARAKGAPVETARSGWLAWMPRSGRWLVPALACLVALAVYVGVRWVPGSPGSNRQAPGNESRNNVPRVADSAAVFSIVLTPPLTRGAGGGSTYVVPDGAKQIRLVAEFSPKEQFSRYSGELKTPEGATIWKGDLTAISAENGKVRGVILTDLSALPRTDLILTISGTTIDGETRDIEDFSFRLR